MADREINSVCCGDRGSIFTGAHAAPATSSSAESRVALNLASIKKTTIYFNSVALRVKWEKIAKPKPRWCIVKSGVYGQSVVSEDFVHRCTLNSCFYMWLNKLSCIGENCLFSYLLTHEFDTKSIVLLTFSCLYNPLCYSVLSILTDPRQRRSLVWN